MQYALCLANMDRDREALDMVLNKVIGLYQSDQSQGQAPELKGPYIRRDGSFEIRDDSHESVISKS